MWDVTRCPNLVQGEKWTKSGARHDNGTHQVWATMPEPELWTDVSSKLTKQDASQGGSVQRWADALCLACAGSLNTILWCWLRTDPCGHPAADLEDGFSGKKWARISTYLYILSPAHGCIWGLYLDNVEWINERQSGDLALLSGSPLFFFKMVISTASPQLLTQISHNEIYCIIYVILK